MTYRDIQETKEPINRILKKLKYIF